MQNFGPRYVAPQKPTEAGLYLAKEIILGIGYSQLKTPVKRVRVVEDAPNPRNHKLMVETGIASMPYRGLDCYEWVIALPLRETAVT